MSNFDAECRICQEKGSDMSPLVSPCACRGGSKYVHLECLQQWAGTKDDEEQERQVAWKRGAAYLECITCKQRFFGETAVALGRESLLRTAARHQRATAESADSFERTQLDVAESLNNLALLLKVSPLWSSVALFVSPPHVACFAGNGQADRGRGAAAARHHHLGEGTGP